MKEDLRQKFQIFFLTMTLGEGVYWWKLEKENTMQINIIRSDKVYQELLELPFDKREGCFRAKILAPLLLNTKHNTFL